MKCYNAILNSVNNVLKSNKAHQRTCRICVVFLMRFGAIYTWFESNCKYVREPQRPPEIPAVKQRKLSVKLQYTTIAHRFGNMRMLYILAVYSAPFSHVAPFVIRLDFRVPSVAHGRHCLSPLALEASRATFTTVFDQAKPYFAYSFYFIFFTCSWTGQDTCVDPEITVLKRKMSVHTEFKTLGATEWWMQVYFESQFNAMIPYAPWCFTWTRRYHSSIGL